MPFPDGYRIIDGNYFKMETRSGPYFVNDDGEAVPIGGSTPGGSTVIPPGGGDPVALPINGVLGDGDAVVVGMAGVFLPRTVWRNAVPGDAVRIRYRVDSAAPWVEYSNGAGYIEHTLEAPLHEIEFQRISGSGTTSVWGVR